MDEKNKQNIVDPNQVDSKTSENQQIESEIKSDDSIDSTNAAQPNRQSDNFMDKKSISQDENNYEDEDEAPEVEQELSKVASNPKQSMAILAVFFVIFAYIFYTNFIATGETEKNNDIVPEPKNVVRPAERSETMSNIPEIPTLPSPPELDDPSLPPPPPPLAEDGENIASIPLDTSVPDLEITSGTNSVADLSPEAALPENTNIELPEATSNANEAKQQRAEQKRKSNVLLVGGAPPPISAVQAQQAADFSKRGDLGLLLTRGKIIEAALESSIDSDFGGEIRAVVARNVYSQRGKNILIPKGSRIFGTYIQGFDGSKARVAVNWTRIDLTNGYSINFSGNAVGGLGKTGVEGRLDTKLKETLANAVMLSAFNIVVANALDRIVTPELKKAEADQRSATSSSLRTFASEATATNDAEAATAMSSLCTQINSAVTTVTTEDFADIIAACADKTTLTGANDSERLTSLKDMTNQLADTLLTSATNQSTQTTEQKAAADAFTNITDKMKQFIEQDALEPTVTVGQGTKIRIYVNRDFNFPKQAVSLRGGNR